MRHRVAHRKLGRVTEHRIAMLRNQAHALLKHERIETTMPRAKELRPFVERIISIAKRGVAGGAENGQSLHARRMVLRDIQDRDVVSKLFDTIAPRVDARAYEGGATYPLQGRTLAELRGEIERLRSELPPLPEEGAEFVEVVFAPGADSSTDDRPSRHAGREYALVLEGTLEVRIGRLRHRLGPGD